MDSTRKRPSAKRVVFAVGAAIIAVLFVFNLAYHEPIDEGFLRDYDQFDSYEQVNSSPAVFEVYKDGGQVGYLVFGSHYGYQSDVTMATLVSNDGTVLDARTYSQNESPSYYRRLLGNGFFRKNFSGKSIGNGFSISTNVDAVTHATLSSNAATEAVQEGVTYVGEHYLGVKVAQHHRSFGVGALDVGVIVMLVLSVVASRHARKRWLVWLCRVYSIVVMGFIAVQFLTLSVFVALFSLDWPSVVDYLRWYLLVFGVLAIIIATGKNTYCSYACPFGALQEVVFAFGGSIGKGKLNPKVGKLLRWFPGILVFVSLALSFWFHTLDFANYEPFSLIFGQTGLGIQWVLLPLVLLGALFYRRIYCSFICPVGYVLGKVVSLRRLVRNAFAHKSAPQPALAAAGQGAESAVAAQELGSEADAGNGSRAAVTSAPGGAKADSSAGRGASGKMGARDILVLCIGLACVAISLLTIISSGGAHV